MIYHDMENVEKSKFTNLLSKNGGVYENFEKNVQCWLVPSGYRPGHRTEHLFLRTESGWLHCEIKKQGKLKHLKLPESVTNTLEAGINPALPDRNTDHLSQDMIFKTEDRKKSIIYGFFKLPNGWRSHGEFQLFCKRPRDKAWAYLRNYKDLNNILSDKALSTNVRNHIRKQAIRQTA